MDIESKIWSLTNTGTKLHAFEGGVALCSKAVRERQGPGEGFDYCGASQGPFKLCTRCDARFNAALEAIETAPAPEPTEAPACCEHAPMYHGARGCDSCGCTTPRTPAEAPACACPALEPPAKYGHHVVCPLYDTNEEENGMASETTTRTGPLTDLQMSIMTGLMQGKTNYQVGAEHDKGRTHTANIIAAAVAKMGCETSRQAIALLATRNAYLEAAGLIDAGVFRDPLDETEEHVNRVLVGLAQILRDRAAKLLPS